MKVRTRLLLFGAALPLLGTLAAVLVAGQLFYLSLLSALDRSLDELAAIESVSLFDGPDGHPHLPPTEPGAHQGLLARGVVSVYDSAGRPVLRVPSDASVPATAPSGGQPGLRTSTALGGAPTRERAVRIMSRDGHAFLLWVAAPLGELRATVATFFQVTLAVCAGMAILLLGLQGFQARRLGNRIATMARYLPHLREGDFDAELPADPTGDELAELRTGLADASRQLKAARERQERLIANAAHEIQTPLACMRTSMDVALMKQRSAEELREALRDSRADVDRLAALSRSLLDLAAAGRVGLERNEVDLGALVRASAEGFRNEADRRGVALTTSIEAPELITMGAALALRQALDNLVGNAIKFSPSGARVLVRLQRQGPGARIIVSDNGPGVPERARATVFEPFYRASKGAPGSGLGLAIARELARQHGGEVLLLPSAEGACFALDLPLAEPEPRRSR